MAKGDAAQVGSNGSTTLVSNSNNPGLGGWGGLGSDVQYDSNMATDQSGFGGPMTGNGMYGNGMPQPLGQMGSAMQSSNTAAGNGYPQVSTGGPLMAMRFAPQQYSNASQPYGPQNYNIGSNTQPQQDFWSKLIQSFANQQAPGMNYFNRMQ